MASVKKTSETRNELVVKSVPVVQLTLEQDEAAALVSVLRNVGGQPEAGRKHVTSTLKALEQAGVKQGSHYLNGTLYFGKRPSYTSSLSDFSILGPTTSAW